MPMPTQSDKDDSDLNAEDDGGRQVVGALGPNAGVSRMINAYKLPSILFLSFNYNYSIIRKLSLDADNINCHLRHSGHIRNLGAILTTASTRPTASIARRRKTTVRAGASWAARYRGVIIDDVITAGTAIRESVDNVKANRAELAGGSETKLSAIEQVQQDYAIPVVSIVSLKHVVAYLTEIGKTDEVESITEHWSENGVGSL
ncbi:hypothetical protein BC830DRAFT_1215623 [Chytriomyces sp. MP71]|nr:hypothetical protein BC830DRAFT_1215623 [Chytriomyces sp. MP71]